MGCSGARQRSSAVAARAEPSVRLAHPGVPTVITRAAVRLIGSGRSRTTLRDPAHPGSPGPPALIETDPPQPGTAAGGDSPDRYEEFLALFTGERKRIFAYIFSLLPHHA